MKILFVDDHKMFRDGMKELLIKEEFCNSVVSSETIQEAIKNIENENIDILITDLNLKNENGLDLLKRVNSDYPQILKICMTMHEDLDTLKKALQHDIKGYITKSSGYNELVTGIKNTIEGKVFFDQIILSKIVKNLMNKESIDSSQSLQQLSVRENEIFKLLIHNKKTREIAEKLFISQKTVENHRTNIYQKLRVNDKFSLMKYAEEHPIQ